MLIKFVWKRTPGVWVKFIKPLRWELFPVLDAELQELRAYEAYELYSSMASGEQTSLIMVFLTEGL